MAETYTGDEGDDALAASMDILDGTEDRRDGWLAINKTRDYIAQFFNSISLTWDAITGKPTTFPPSAHNHSGSNITSGTIPAARIGDNIELHNVISRYGARVLFDTIETTGDVKPSGDLIASGDVIAGDGIHAGEDIHSDRDIMAERHLYTFGATPATSSYQVAYINGDGRVGRNASSERYKTDITPIDPLSLGDIWPTLQQFQMKDGDGTWKFGYIAERLDEHPDQQPFVVYDTEGRPDSIDFIALLLSQVAALEQRLSALEGQ